MTKTYFLYKFSNWSELSLAEWVQYIANNNTELEVSATFAERVLFVISRGYNHISAKSQAEICKILQTKKCIPTRYGMRLPHESYFETVKLFDDLPIIRFENTKHNISDVFLSALGVRKVGKGERKKKRNQRIKPFYLYIYSM